MTKAAETNRIGDGSVRPCLRVVIAVLVAGPILATRRDPGAEAPVTGGDVRGRYEVRGWAVGSGQQGSPPVEGRTRPQVSDDALVAAGRGDIAAFEQLYRLTAAHVLHLAVAVVRDQGMAEEVAQEVFLWVWRHAARFDPARGTAMAWLACITRARSIDRVRAHTAATTRERSYADTGPEPCEDTTWLQIERIDNTDVLAHAWRALTDRQREALSLTYIDGLTGPELSDTLGIPLGTAKARIRDGLIGLRRAVATTHLATT